MNAQSGQSLIEMLGVMAVAGLIAVATLNMYQTARTRHARFAAEQDLERLVENTRIIYSGRKNYAGVSKGLLIKMDALKTEKIGGRDFEVAADESGKTFSIIFHDMDFGDCAYFATKKFDWITAVAVNGATDKPQCAESTANKVEFISR